MLTLTQGVAAAAARRGMQVPHHVCPSCAGHGVIPLSAALLGTWEALDEQEGRTALEVGRRSGASGPAANHRLGALAALGLARIAGHLPGQRGRSKPSALWVRLRAAPVPPDPAERVATWAVLQFWSFGRKPVFGVEKWREHGFNAADAYGASYHAAHVAKGGKPRWDGGDAVLPDVIAGIVALPSLSRVTVLRCSALDVPPIPGAVVYLDPPYDQTTCCYGHALPRPDVLALAARWRAAGASLVAISEAAPLPLPGWHAHELGGPAGFGRTWSKQRREVLTLSRPAAGQLALIA